MPKTLSVISKFKFVLILFAVFLFVPQAAVKAQGLNWEGQTGAFITPFAYTSPSEKDKIGKPQISFHYLNAGSVIGNHYQASITVGAVKRVEFGYTRNFSNPGNTAVSPLFDNGFNIIHGKVKVVEENAGKTKWVPAISAGFVARTNVKRVGGVINNKSETNGDIYVVATKTVTQVKDLPLLFNFGVKYTNASIMGVAGNSPDWKPTVFGAVAAVVKGPAKSTLIFGSEVAQQPKFIKGLPGPTVPPTLTYFVRVLPKAEVPLALDFGVAQIAGKITPGVDLKARHQFAMGISYAFK